MVFSLKQGCNKSGRISQIGEKEGGEDEIAVEPTPNSGMWGISLKMGL